MSTFLDTESSLPTFVPIIYTRHLSRDKILQPRPLRNCLHFDQPFQGFRIEADCLCGRERRFSNDRGLQTLDIVRKLKEKATRSNIYVERAQSRCKCLVL